MNLNKKNLSKKIANQLREDALKRRSKAEIWAHEILLNNFKQNTFKIEYVFKFRRFDFYFPFYKIALEIDGSSHEKKESKKYDIDCDKWLYLKHDILIIRVRNFDEKSMNLAVSEINKIILNPSLRSKRFSAVLNKKFFPKIIKPQTKKIIELANKINQNALKK